MRTEEIKRMVASTSDAAFAIDGEGLVVAWNQAAEALFALPASEAMGRHCAEIVEGAVGKRWYNAEHRQPTSPQPHHGQQSCPAHPAQA